MAIDDFRPNVEVRAPDAALEGNARWRNALEAQNRTHAISNCLMLVGSCARWYADAGYLVWLARSIGKQLYNVSVFSCHAYRFLDPTRRASRQSSSTKSEKTVQG
eukprot:8597889-Pyramimonas_sp.AAC.1